MLVGIPSQTVSVCTASRPIFYLLTRTYTPKCITKYYVHIQAWPTLKKTLNHYRTNMETVLFYAHMCDNYENLHTTLFSVKKPAGGCSFEQVRFAH